MAPLKVSMVASVVPSLPLSPWLQTFVDHVFAFLLWGPYFVLATGSPDHSDVAGEPQLLQRAAEESTKIRSRMRLEFGIMLLKVAFPQR